MLLQPSVHNGDHVSGIDREMIIRDAICRFERLYEKRQGFLALARRIEEPATLEKQANVRGGEWC